MGNNNMYANANFKMADPEYDNNNYNNIIASKKPMRTATTSYSQTKTKI